ncbi:MAG: hypothetical protein ABIX01_20515 [Chitinophagaceae bacterium]
MATQTKNTTIPGIAKAIDSLNKLQRYFVLRSGSKAYHIQDPVIGDNQNMVTATLDELPAEHQLYLGNGYKGKMRYKKIGLEYNPVVDEVHVYIPGDAAMVAGPFSIPLDKVQKIEVIQKNKGKTAISWALGTTVGLVVTVAAISLIAFSSATF